MASVVALHLCMIGRLLWSDFKGRRLRRQSRIKQFQITLYILSSFKHILEVGNTHVDVVVDHLNLLDGVGDVIVKVHTGLNVLVFVTVHLEGLHAGLKLGEQSFLRLDGDSHFVNGLTHRRKAGEEAVLLLDILRGQELVAHDGIVLGLSINHFDLAVAVLNQRINFLRDGVKIVDGRLAFLGELAGRQQLLKFAGGADERRSLFNLLQKSFDVGQFSRVQLILSLQMVHLRTNASKLGSAVASFILIAGAVGGLNRSSSFLHHIFKLLELLKESTHLVVSSQLLYLVHDVAGNRLAERIHSAPDPQFLSLLLQVGGGVVDLGEFLRELLGNILSVFRQGLLDVLGKKLVEDGNGVGGEVGLLEVFVVDTRLVGDGLGVFLYLELEMIRKEGGGGVP